MQVINLITEYGEKFSEEIGELGLSQKYITDKFKVGDVIEFWGGYHSDIRYKSKITGFEGENIFLIWDCYWFPIRDEKIREIILIK